MVPTKKEVTQMSSRAKVKIVSVVLEPYAFPLAAYCTGTSVY